MKIVIPKVIRKLSLKEYAPEIEGEIEVWVNPPKDLLTNELAARVEARGVVDILSAMKSEKDKKADALKEKCKDQLVDIGNRRIAIFSELWSQGSEESRLSVEDLNKLIEEILPTDPNLFNWMADMTMIMINDYREVQKKG